MLNPAKFLLVLFFKCHKSSVNILHSLANYIDGATFVGLTVAEIKEIVPPIDLAKKIVNLLPKACNIFLSPFVLSHSYSRIYLLHLCFLSNHIYAWVYAFLPV